MSRIIPDEVDEEGRKDWITPRRSIGPRTRRRRELQRRRRRRSAGYVIAMSAGIAALVLVIGLVARFIADRQESPAEKAGKGVPTQETWLVVGTVESDRSGEANWLAVFSWDRDDQRGFWMFMPRTTLVELPGFGGGPDAIGKALALGKEPLLLSSASNLMEIRFDHYLRISDQGLQALFDKIGGVDLEIGQKLSAKDPDEKVRVVFAEGPQHLDGARVAEYLTFIDESGDEISRAVRHAELWGKVVERFRKEGGAEAFGAFMAESTDLYVTDAKKDETKRFFAGFAGKDQGALTFETMPVQAQGVDTGIQFYKAEADALQRMVERHLKGSLSEGAGKPGRRVQILNGNGEPGIGQDVGDKLISKGFRVVLGANARSFNYDTTQIVSYSDSEEAIANARAIREALGVGEVLVSRQRQSVVDFTIVVGKDYLQKR